MFVLGISDSSTGPTLCISAELFAHSPEAILLDASTHPFFNAAEVQVKKENSMFFAFLGLNNFNTA